MAKTQANSDTVESYLASVEPPERQSDARTLCTILAEMTGETPKMWGTSMIGFGSYHYRYASGHAGDAALVSFAPRKTSLVFYLAPEEGLKEDLLARLGKHKTGKGCLYVNRLSDVDVDVLKALFASTISALKARYPADR